MPHAHFIACHVIAAILVPLSKRPVLETHLLKLHVFRCTLLFHL